MGDVAAAWSTNTELRIKKLRRNSAKRAQEHYRTYQKLAVRQNCLVIFSGVCGTLVVMLTALNGSLYPEEHKLIPILIAVVACFSSFSQAIVKLTHMEEVKSNHRTATAAHAKLVRNIDRQMDLPKHKRLQEETYYPYIGDTFDQILETSPVLPGVQYVDLMIEDSDQDDAPQSEERVVEIHDNHESENKQPALTHTPTYLHNQVQLHQHNTKIAQDNAMNYELQRFNQNLSRTQ